MSREPGKYSSALKFHWLTGLYDPLMKFMQEEKFKNQLVSQADLLPDQRILDLGCGTGTLTLMLKEAQPKATIIGLDVDFDVLARAEKKAQENQLNISFQQGLASELPFEDGQFDHVFSSLLFHHLTLEMKHRTLAEVSRVLVPGGSLYILDFDAPANRWMRIAFLPVQFLDGFETTRDHAKGILLELLQEEGFEEIRETNQINTVVGTLRVYYAKKHKP